MYLQFNPFKCAISAYLYKQYNYIIPTINTKLPELELEQLIIVDQTFKHTFLKSFDSIIKGQLNQ